MSHSDLLTVTDAAVSRVAHLIKRRADGANKLRIYIEGGGCSGFQYCFALEHEAESDDHIIDTQSLKMLVDPLSIHYLKGATLDFQDDLIGARFVVLNPNASATCGCGSSFAMH